MRHGHLARFVKRMLTAFVLALHVYDGLVGVEGCFDIGVLAVDLIIKNG